MSAESQLLNDFLVESADALDRLDRDLLALEKDVSNASLLNEIFRTAHSFKGTAGFFGLQKVESLTHLTETLLEKVRAGQRKCDSDLMSVLFKVLDAVRRILANVERDGGEGAESHDKLASELRGLIDAATPPCVPENPDDELERLLEQNRQELWNQVKEREMEQQPEPPKETKFADTVGAEATTTSSERTSMEETKENTTAIGAHPHADDAARSSLSDASLRVDVGLLDQLMNLVGELVLSRNQILQYSRGQKDHAFLNASQRLNLITSELQEGVMRTRMQPVSNVWNKFPRVVRDLARQLKKQVRLEMEGKDTELDKTIIEAIKDPLTHIIRNSIDHGIESPETRIGRGKDGEGTVHLRAFHEGGLVIMEISDDGAGLNVERIKQKAVEKGIISGDQARQMSDDEAHRLIFAPGFSTAEVVTNVSGRGVGMDVVRSNIERIGGQVDITSKSGFGSTIRLKIPLTLAIIPALVVSSQGERFAIPQVVLVELVRAEGEQLKLRERIGKSTFFRLRGALLPLVSLSAQLELSPADANTIDESTGFTFVVVRADEQTFGIVVDQVHDVEEIVVKPLGSQLKGLSVFAGATVMGDGQVALIIDVLGIAKRAGVLAEQAEKVQDDVGKSSEGDRASLLLVEVAEGHRAALSLELVHRLEQFQASAVEYAGGKAVVQYREGILPLIDLAGFFEASSNKTSEEVKVVVYAKDTDLIGLVVNKIEDIVEERLVLHDGQRRRGTRGAAIIQKRVTDVLNPEEIIATAQH